MAITTVDSAKRERLHWPFSLSLLRPALPMLPAVLFLFILYGLPVLDMVRRSFGSEGFTLAHYARFFTTPAEIQVLVDTFKISLAVTLTCILLGYPVSYLLAQTSPHVRNFLLIAVVAPWLTSTLVRNFAWIILLGRMGPINQMLLKLGLVDQPIPLIGTSLAVYIAMVHVQMPLAILPMYSVMQRIDHSLVRVAQGLGANPLQAFLHVFLPLSLPGVTGAGLLLFIGSLGFYITPVLLGGTSDLFIANLIDMQISAFLNWEAGAAIAFILLLTTVAVFLIYNRVMGMDRLLGEDSR